MGVFLHYEFGGLILERAYFRNFMVYSGQNFLT